MLAEVKGSTGVDLPLSAMVEHPTLRALSAAVEARRRGGRVSPRESDPAIVELRPGGSPPLVLVHCYEGAAFFYRPFLQHLRSDRAVVALNELRFAGRWRGGESVEEIAASCLRGWDDHRPEGSRLVLGGYSAGGGIAYEMACRLLARGTRVDGLVLLDPASSIPMYDRQVKPETRIEPPGVRSLLEERWRRASSWTVGFARRRLRDLRFARVELGIGGTIEMRNQLNFDRHWDLMIQYRPRPLPGRVPVLFVACSGDRTEATMERYLAGWIPLLGGDAEVRRVGGSHFGDQSFLAEPHVAEVGRVVAEFLDREARPRRDGSAVG